MLETKINVSVHLVGDITTTTNVKMKRSNEDETTETPPPKRNKLDVSLDLNNLGAGYDIEEKKVQRAVQFYEKELLPYIKANPRIFEYSNFMSIKGYGTYLKQVQHEQTKSR